MDLERQLESRILLGRLFDLYSGLLTERQRKAFELHDLSDLSLQEIAEMMGGSRQSVYDLVQRARQRLLELEEVLRFGTRLETQVKTIRFILSRFSNDLPSSFLVEMEKALAENAEEAEERDV
ncbi:MAG: sigma factor-like helix-turn-helix DNA-binding protein [Synergistales bacterium]|jgi:predicted DNA-binding protein YlxM (UPF0122 family)